MPNKPAAKKAWRQTKKHAAQNAARQETFKNAIKKALKASNAVEAKQLARAAQQALFKAAKRGVIKPNAAARRLSRLMKKINTPKR